MKKNITLLYGFSFFDQFMIVIAVWVPYLATQGIGMRQFMELQAGELLPPPAVEQLRGLPRLPPHHGHRPQHDLGGRCGASLNERISSAFRATVISMAQLGIRAFFCLLGPLVGYGIDAWGLPSVLSALGILFSIAFVFLLLPLVLSPAESVRA